MALFNKQALIRRAREVIARRNATLLTDQYVFVLDSSAQPNLQSLVKFGNKRCEAPDDIHLQFPVTVSGDTRYSGLPFPDVAAARSALRKEPLGENVQERHVTVFATRKTVRPPATVE